MYRYTLLSSIILGLVVQNTIAATIDVTVGGPGILQYNPPFVNANPGDTIRFTFKQKNHTATQSSFESPCVKAPGGFDTGFIPVADSATEFPVAQLTVANTNPVWVYCQQANHCEQGMVFAVNPGDKFAAFQAAAKGGATASTSASTPAASGFITVTTTLTVSGSTVPTTYTTTTSSSAPSTSSTTGVDHKIIVGGPNILAYSPSNITAQIGDTVTFEFHQKNHTVTASSFDTPCRALSSTSTTGQLGFDSGFMPVADGTTDFPTFTIRVNDTNPIWAYCRQTNHCGSGMVFSVNAVETGPKNFSAFQDLAKQQNGTTTPPKSGAVVSSVTSYPSFIIVAASLFLFFL